MSMFSWFWRALHTYVTGNFHCNDLAYILYPFARIYKLLGFAPIKLRRGEFLRNGCGTGFQWDAKACIWTGVNVIIYTMGFFCGLHQLQSAAYKRGDGISHLTGWAQVYTLFILGLVAWITAWTHMEEQCRLCAVITNIDQRLRDIAEIEFDYGTLRKRLFWQLGLELLIAFPLSMVNCIIIQPDERSFQPVSACFWFICFAPISLLIFKQFQFCHLMRLLKSKFELINSKLGEFNGDTNFGTMRRRIMTVRKTNSVSEVPLTTTVATSAALDELPEEPNVEILQKLLTIYSNVSDGIDLVLSIFGCHLLCLTAVSFGVITIQSYNLFSLVSHTLAMPVYHVVFIVAWILVQVMAIAVNVIVCSRTSKTMEATVSILHKMRVSSQEKSTASLFYQILQIFSMEVMQRKRNFNAAGFFDMDYKLITSIFASATTYLVIIIQFHLTNIPDCHFPKE